VIGIIGAIFSIVLVYFLTSRRDQLPWLLSASMPFVATAAYIVAGQSIVIYHVIAVVVVAVAVRSAPRGGLLATDLTARPGMRLLAAFGLWAIAVTAVAPVIFEGTPVLNPRDGIDAGIINPALLGPQISNLAQGGYLIIGVATVAAIGSMGSLSPRLPAAGFAVGTVLSSARGLLPTDLQRTLFDNSPNVGYTTGAFNGIERMRGVFSEPSALGSFSVATMVFFALTASAVQGYRRWLCVVLAVWAFVNSVLSFSGGAIVSGLAILAILGVRAGARYLTSRSAVSPMALVAGLLLAPAAMVVGGPAYAFVAQVVDEKQGSDSYENRNAADAFSIDLAHQTAGIGVGVGSNRPSSFFAMLISCTGVPGVVLFALAVAVIILGAMAAGSQWHPAAWALIAALIGKVVAGPDLSEPVMWFLLAVCAHAAWHRRDTVDAALRLPAPGRPVLVRTS
jgi:hypothetical protein